LSNEFVEFAIEFKTVPDLCCIQGILPVRLCDEVAKYQDVALFICGAIGINTHRYGVNI
jgi:hypothetical protein